jgi:tetratricopeptide (TPR) repeat protein
VRARLAWLGALSWAAATAAQPVSQPQSAPKPPSAAKPSSTARPQPAARPQSVRALLELAHQQSERKDVRGALETLRKARALARNSEEVLYAYAEASLAVRAPLPAIPVLESLTRMCPSVGEYQYLLGMALVQAGDVAAAFEPLKEAERLEPNEPPILVALGTALNERKLYTEAKPPLLHALSLAPDSVEATAALAEAEAGLGELQEAEAHAQRALVRSGADATANRVMGMVRMKQDRYADARDALLKAVASDPSSTKAQYQLSLAYARLNDTASAEKHLALYRRCAAEAESRLKEVRALTGFSLGGMQP